MLSLMLFSGCALLWQTQRYLHTMFFLNSFPIVEIGYLFHLFPHVVIPSFIYIGNGRHSSYSHFFFLLLFHYVKVLGMKNAFV